MLHFSPKSSAYQKAQQTILFSFVLTAMVFFKFITVHLFNLLFQPLSSFLGIPCVYCTNTVMNCCRGIIILTSSLSAVPLRLPALILRFNARQLTAFREIGANVFFDNSVPQLLGGHL